MRAGQPVPKQFANWRGKPVVWHSANAFASAGASPIIVAIPDGAERLAKAALAGLPGIRLVTGGMTRQESVVRALALAENDAPQLVLIHDAARPDLGDDVIARLLGALQHHQGAIPVLPVVDSLSVDEAGIMSGSAERDSLRRVQTPQGFVLADILAAHKSWRGERGAGDDAQVAHAFGLSVVHVAGDEKLHKLTFAEDFLPDKLTLRVGTGFDVHRLVENEELWLCGLKIEHSHGLSGHSDADVALHAVVDAMLGAAGAGDIGDHFPPDDPQWKGASSDRFVGHALLLLNKAGYRVGNVDLTIICEAPKIGPHRAAMRSKLAELLDVHADCVSVKATTTERLGFTGRGEGIAAQAAVTILLN